jgi:hypothetical protein
MDTPLLLLKHFKSLLPAANISSLNAILATVALFLDIPALDDEIVGHGGTAMLQYTVDRSVSL